MASLAITRDELLPNIAMVLGIARDPDNWSTETAADVERILRAGRRRFLSAHDWEFLREPYRFLTVAPFTTSTVTIASGVVTLDSGVFPATAAGQQFVVGGESYRVASRDSDTQLTLDDTSVSADAGSAYSLYTVRYALPANFSMFLGEPVVEGERMSYTLVVPEYSTRRLMSLSSPRTDAPRLFSIERELDADDYGITTHYLNLYPLPDRVYSIEALIEVQLDDAAGADDTDSIAAPIYSELYQEAILAQAEVMYNNDVQGPHNIRFAQLLPEAVRKDRATAGVRGLLPRRDSHGSSGPYDDPYYQLRIAPMDYAD